MSRSYGILMPLFSLPSTEGIGDFGREAYSFVDLLADHGVKYWQILPLNPGNPENGESPYFSSSAYAINPLLISLEALKEEGLLHDTELFALPQFPAGVIDYAGVRAAKMPLLEKAAVRFKSNESFESFCRVNRSWLGDYTVYEELRKENAGPWNQWPVPLRDRDAHDLNSFVTARRNNLRISKVIQYFAWSQWTELRRYCAQRGVSIIGDMPIYVALDSADVWANPSLFKLDVQRCPTSVSGVPPDYFSATGQLWNNPVYDWKAHQSNSFAWWVARMRHLFGLYDIVRIDHFRGLVQYWEVPAGEKTAINGAWRDVPTYELFDALIAAIQPFPVICEDLGIITDDVRAAIERYGFPGMRVLQFAFGDDDPKSLYLPVNYDDRCLAYTGTHDNPPSLAWLRAADERELSRIRRLTGRAVSLEETLWDLIGAASRSNAAIAVLPMQDVLGLDANARINDPAQLHGNWRWRWNAEREPARAGFRRLHALGRECGRSE